MNAVTKQLQHAAFDKGQSPRAGTDSPAPVADTERASLPKHANNILADAERASLPKHANNILADTERASLPKHANNILVGTERASLPEHANNILVGTEQASLPEQANTIPAGTERASAPERAEVLSGRDLSARSSVLLAATPDRWYEVACERWRELLVDHANCEKKAASTALSLIFSYPEDMTLTDKLSRLAREELRHFEQVQKLMQELAVPFQRMQPSRYAEGLRSAISRSEPARLLDLLLCGALIEARSCERFERLGPLLSEPLRGFYTGLAVSEARHQSLYLRLAEQRAGTIDWRARLQTLSAIESDLVTTPDPQFRFHSGLPEAHL